MSKQNEKHLACNNSVVVFIDYTPAELRMGKDWLIVYYCKHPLTLKLERQRLRVPVMSNKRERERYGKRLALEVNRKLEGGWSPYLENKSDNTFKSFDDACDTFLKLINKEKEDGIKRFDTIRSYTSQINLIKTYIAIKNIKIGFAIEFNKIFITKYLDWGYYERGNSPRTYNNYLTFLKVFATFLVEKGYVKENPTIGIKPKPKTQKKRIVFPAKVREQLRLYVPAFNNNYYTLCLMAYYCLIRRTEITKLRVSDIDLQNSAILIRGKEVSKSNKIIDKIITIPDEYLPMIAAHLEGADQDDYLFSKEDWKPGKEQLAPKIITITFDKIKLKLGFTSEIQWYGFKDTGIDDLFHKGTPAVKVKNQARHEDIRTTEMYAGRVMGSDTTIRTNGLQF